MTGGTLLQDAMGMIDLSYIAEVADALPVRPPKRKPLLRYAALAACFCLLIGSLTIMTIYRNSRGRHTHLERDLQVNRLSHLANVGLTKVAGNTDLGGLCIRTRV